MGKRIGIWAYSKTLDMLKDIQGKNKFINQAIQEKCKRLKNEK